MEASLLKNGYQARVESLLSKGWELHYILQFSWYSLSFSAVSQIRLTWHIDVYYTTHTHTSWLPRLSSPGLGSLLNHLAKHCVVYWANWIPQYQNQKMPSSINWLRQLIACTRPGKTTSTENTNQITRIVTANNWAWQLSVGIPLGPKLEISQRWCTCLIARSVNPTFDTIIFTAGHPHYQITWFLVVWSPCNIQIPLQNIRSETTK